MANFPRRKTEAQIDEDTGSGGFTSFEAIGNMKPEEIERPLPIPQGDYDAMIEGSYETGFSSQKGTPFYQWNVRVIAPLGNVDMKEFNAANKYTRLTVWVPKGEDDAWKLSDLCDKLGIPQANSLNERLAQTPNQRLGVSIKHTVEGDATFVNIRRTFSLD